MYLIKTTIMALLLLLVQNNSHGQQKNKKSPPKKVIPVTIQTVAPTFELDIEGDTINYTDQYSLKQGRWVIEKKSRYEDYSSKEVGNYINGKKFGEWKLYEGSRVVKIENYKDDKLSGNCRYYEDGILACTGFYYALVGTGNFDTVYVVNPVTEELKKYVIPTEKRSVREGKWTYYYNSGKIMRIDLYLMDDLISSKTFDEFTVDSTFIKNYINGLPSTDGAKIIVPFGKKNITIPRFGKVPGEKSFVMPQFGQQEKIKRR